MFWKGPTLIKTGTFSSGLYDLNVAYDNVQKIDLLRVTNQPWTLVATAYNYELERQDFLPSIHGLLEEEITAPKKKSC